MASLSTSTQCGDSSHRRQSKRKSLVQDIPLESIHHNHMAFKSCLKRGLPSSTPPSEKSVRFSERAHKYESLHINDYTNYERQACYYTRANLAEWRRDTNKTLRVMRTGQLPDSELCYFRGLECELVKTRKERNERVDLALFAIQEYQTEHENEQGLKDEWVNTIYRTITSASVESAKRAAIYDEIQAENVYRETEREGADFAALEAAPKAAATPIFRRFKRRFFL